MLNRFKNSPNRFGILFMELRDIQLKTDTNKTHKLNKK